MKANKLILILVSCLSLISCKPDAEAKKDSPQLPSQAESSDMNKIWIKEEHELIDKYIERNEWEVTKTGSGLRYLIYKNGTGESPKPGMRAMIAYDITLLDGTKCYSTDEIGPQPFIIEQDFVESGLHEAITYLKVGDRAKIIIPSYLAHGLAGDQNKIPVLSTVVYDLKLLGISN